MMKKNNLFFISKAFLVVAALLLLISIFVPIWHIDLDAPQYPEGLRLLIYANKIAGDVEIINGLNHYIGMKTLHTKDFIEFTILPYIIALFAVLFLYAALKGTKKWLYGALIAFVVFGIVAMVDFWLWEYNYGHNLDPNAAIIVPGMAYQPPLIGFKQLLNFGAFSIPDVGGWLFIGAGILLAIAAIKESGWFQKKVITTPVIAVIAISIGLNSCGSDTVNPIKLNTDNCASCQMTIASGQFGAALLTSKGREYKFDDLYCLFNYQQQQQQTSFKKFLVHDFNSNNTLIDAEKAFYVQHENLKSPMGGNTAAFATKEAALQFAVQNSVPVKTWQEIHKP